MRHHPSCWNHVLAKLGYRRIPRHRREAAFRGRLSRIESLEARQMMSVTVNTLTDTIDGDPTVTSLREAIAAAPANGAEVVFDASLAGGVITLNSQLTLPQHIAIIGLGADKLTLDARYSSRIFFVNSGVTATISGLTLTGGKAVSHHGGAIYNNGGNLKLQEMMIADSHADGVGGGVFNNLGSTLTIENSTFLNNSAPTGGGLLTSSTNLTKISGSAFIGNVATSAGGAMALGGAAGGAVSVHNSTFTGNRAAANSGAIQVAAPNASITVVNSTITDNRVEAISGEGGGLRIYSGTATLHNSIVAGNAAGAASTLDVGGTIVNSSNNLFSQTTVNGVVGGLPAVAASAIFVDDPALPGYQPLLADNGGPTKTHALRIDSPAIDQGSNALALTASIGLDQRGYNRFVDNASHSVIERGAVDIGAYEYGLVVTTPTDGPLGGSARSHLSLREALALAAKLTGPNQIEFAPRMEGVISLGAAGHFIIDSDVEIVGPGTDKLALDAHNATRVFYVEAGKTAAISGLTLTRGEAGGGHGGAIYNNGGIVKLQKMTVADSHAGGVGGALFNNASGSLDIVDSTFIDNEAPYGGAVFTASTNPTLIAGSTFVGNKSINGLSGSGGALVLGGAAGGAVSIRNSTFSRNLADANAAAIQVAAPSALLTVVNSTITDNKAQLPSSEGGGIRVYSGAATLHNTIVAGNSAGVTGMSDFGGVIASPSSHNLFSQATVSGLILNQGNQTNVSASSLFVDDPSLPGYQPLLADNGGPTRTISLQFTSTNRAIDHGSSARANDAQLRWDQRGFNRFANGSAQSSLAVDIGAFELVASLGAIGDFNGDGRDDRLRFDLATRSLQVVVGAATAAQYELQSWGTLPAGVTVASTLISGDFNGDGRDDLLVRGSSTYYLAISDGASFILHPAPLPLNWGHIYVGDFDNDGSDEILGGALVNSTYAWSVAHYQDASGLGVPVATMIHGFNPNGEFFVQDANRDGRDDLIVRLNSSAPWMVSLAGNQNGSVTFHPAADWDAWLDDGYDQATAKLNADKAMAKVIEEFEWIYNNVELEIYPGLMKGPEATRQTKAGNNWDQAALLERRLQELGVGDVKIATGKVRIAADQFGNLANWLGVKTVNAALKVLARLDSNVVARDANGNNAGTTQLPIVAIEFTHAWVQAQVPTSVGLAWVNLDPSWKFKDRQDGISLASTLELDAVHTSLGTGIFDEYSYLALDSTKDRSLPIEFFEDQLMSWLSKSTAHQGSSLADVAYDGPIRAKSFATLPAGFMDGMALAATPGVVTYDDFATIANHPALKNELTHRVRIRLLKGTTEHWFEDLVVPSHSLDAIHVTFSSSLGAITDITNIAPVGSTAFFGRLVVGGELKEAAQSGESFGVNDNAVIELIHFAPTRMTKATELLTTDAAYVGPSGYDKKVVFTEAPGDVISIGLEANQHSHESLAALQATLLAATAGDTTEAQLIKDVALLGSYAIAKYWYDYQRHNDAIAGYMGAVSAQSWVGSGRIKAKPNLLEDPTGPVGDVIIDYLAFGIAPEEFGIDLPNTNNGALSIITGDFHAEAWQLMGYNISAMEHNIVEEMISAESVSTIKGLQKAYRRNLGLNGSGNSVSDDVIRVFESRVTGATRTVYHVYNIRAGGSGVDVIGTAGVGTAVSESDFKSLLVSHANATDVDDSLWDFLSNKKVNGIGPLDDVLDDVRSLATRHRTKVDSWVGAVYFTEIPGRSLVFAIRPDGGTSTNGGYSGGVTTPPPPELKLGNFLNSTWAGDPVNVANGNMFRDEVDFTFPNLGTPLSFARHYDSQSKDDVGLGAGWTFTFGDVLYTESAAPNDLVWLDARGARHTFKWNGSNGFNVPNDLRGTLRYINPSTGTPEQTTTTITGTNKWTEIRFKSADGTEFHFQRITNYQPFGQGGTWTARLRMQLDANGDGVKVTLNPQFPYHQTIEDVHDPSRRLTWTTITGGDGNVAFNDIALYNGTSQPAAKWRFDMQVLPAAQSVAYSPYRLEKVIGNYSPGALPDDLRTTSFSYHPSSLPSKGLIKRITEPDGAWHEYEYFRNSRVFRVKQGEAGQLPSDATVDVQTFSYNLLKMQTEFTDERGNVETYLHQKNGLLTKQIHADRSRIESSWGAINAADEYLMTSTTDERGAVESFTYYGSGDPAFKQGHLKDSTAKHYANQTGLLTRHDYVQPNSGKPHLVSPSTVVVDPNSMIADPVSGYYVGQKLTTTHAYHSSGDAIGKLWKTTDARGHTVEYEYYPASHSPAYLQGLLKSIKRPAIVDATGVPVAYETLFDYDAAGNVKQTMTQTVVTAPAVPALIAKSTFAYNAFGGVGRSRGPSDVVTDSLYDGLGRLIETGYGVLGTPVFNPIDEFTSKFKYDGMGRVRELIDPLGRSTKFEYDRQGNLVKQINSDGTEMLHAYDSFGNRVATTDALKRTSRFVYDGRNRLIQTIHPDGAVERLRYDGVGNVVASIDALGNVTTFRYDAAGRLLETKIPDPDGPNNDDGGDNLTSPTTTNKYDKFGNLVETIDPEANVTQFKHDKLGRIVQTQTLKGVIGNRNAATPWIVAGTLQSLMTIDYDAVGNVIETATYDVSQYDAAATAALLADPRAQQTAQNIAANKVQVVSTRHDAFGRPIKTINADGTSTRTVYDPAGQVRFLHDELDRVTEFVYDSFGRLERTKLPDPTTGTITSSSPTTIHQHDAVGNRIATTDPIGRTTRFEYDVFNRLAATVDPLGGRSQSVYDVAGQMIASVDPLGRVDYTLYDRRGRAIQRRSADPDGAGPGVAPVTRYVHDAAGRISKMTDSLGYDTSYFHDRLGRLRVELHVAAILPTLTLASRQFEYDGNGNVTKSIDELGRVTDVQFDELDRPVKTTAPVPGGNGSTSVPLPRPQTTTAYDGYGNVKSVVEHRGGGLNQRLTTYAYDARNRRTEEIFDVGVDIVNGSGVVTTDYLNRNTDYFYDHVGNLIETRELAGHASLQRRTRTWYDALNRPIQETRNDDGNQFSLGVNERNRINFYDAAGRLVQTLEVAANDPRQAATLFTYDALGRLIKQTDQGVVNGHTEQRISRFQYDAVGNQIAAIDPLGHVTRSEYDRLDRLVKSTAPDADGPGGPLAPEATRFVYDAAGQVISETNGAFETQTFVYDPQGRLIESALGSDVTKREYDAAGNLKKFTDPAQNVTTYEYDGLNRKRLEVASSGAREWLYDGKGDLTVTVDRNGRATRSSYVRDGRQGRSWEYATRADALAGPVDSNNYIAFNDRYYDALGRLEEEVVSRRVGYAGAFLYRVTDSYVYDGLDRVIERSNQSLRPGGAHSSGVPAMRQTYAYGYDAGGRTVVREQFVAGQFAAGTKSTYNAFEELARQEDKETTFAATPAASAILAFESTDAVFSYLGDGSLASTTRYTDWDGTLSGHRNRVQTTYAYDGAGRLKTIAHAQSRRATASWPADANLVSFAYGYDGAGRINAIGTDWNTTLAAFSSRADETQSFAYDAAGQLTLVDSNLTGGDAGYAYGANGNRAAAAEPGGGIDAYQTAPGNRVSQDSTRSYEYDAEGNVTTVYLGTDPQTRILWESYEWDHRNRLVRSENMAQVVVYRYNAGDDLVYRSVVPGGQAAQIEHYLVEGGRRALSFETDGDVKRRYQYGPTGEALFDQVFDATGNPTLQVEQDLLVPLGDHQHSTRVVLAHDAGGATYVRQSLDYAQFGRVTATLGAGGLADAGGVVTAYAHHGSLLDAATGLQHKAARWYSPDLGRFVSEDPIQDGSNWYAFAGNDPVNFADPTGLALQGHPLAGGYSGGKTVKPTIPSGNLFGGFVDANRGRQILGLPAISPPVAAPRQPTAGEQFNRSLTNSSNLAALTRTVDPLQSMIQQQRATDAYRVDQTLSALRGINEAGLVENAQLLAIRDSDPMGTVYRNSRAADHSVSQSIYNAVGTGVASVVGVRGVSDAFSRHDAVDAHRQSAWERGFDGLTGTMQLAGTAVPIAGALRPATTTSAVTPARYFGIVDDSGIDLTTYVPRNGGIGPVRAGQAGETISTSVTGLPVNTTRIPAASGQRAYRIPDHMEPISQRYIAETKNVKYQSLTSQILDDAAYVNRGGLPGRVDVIIDTRTNISLPLLREHLNQGSPIKVQVQPLSGGVR